METQSDIDYTIHTMIEEEREWIKGRREKAKVAAGDPANDAFGLSFSGGGIRSATFNLGILQAFHKIDVLKKFDYLSTVSGGGFIGSSFTWFTLQNPDIFPFGSDRSDHNQTGGLVLAWLRAYGNYLTPDRSMNGWAFMSACLTAILVNLAIVVPILLALFFLLTRDFTVILNPLIELHPLLSFGSATGNSGFWFLLALGSVFLLIVMVRIVKFVVISRLAPYTTAVHQRLHWQSMGRLLGLTVFLFITALIPLFHGIMDNCVHLIMSGISLSGVLSVLAGFKDLKGRKATSGFRKGLLPLGLTLVVYGLFLWIFHLTQSMKLEDYPLILSLLAVSLVLATFANINVVSIHRFYRNRLMEAYMPFDVSRGNEREDNDYPGAKPEDADRCYLSKLQSPSRAPYHLINATIQTMGSDNPKLKRRYGDSFVFSPLYCGSKSTDYVKTESYMGGEMDLATAFAVSGAALDPNTLATRSRSLSFLITLLNLRTGYWARNPGKKASIKKLSHPTWFYYIFKDLLGEGLDETCEQIHLTDGGHFENLALYELIRRKCRYIVVSDAGADPNWDFQNLSCAIERVRVDFGAKISLDVQALKPKGDERISDSPYVTGQVLYEDGSTAELLYIKTCIIKGLQEDIYGYRRENPLFPDQTTADQFFDERQFEAYRELGFQIGKRVAMEKLLQW